MNDLRQWCPTLDEQDLDLLDRIRRGMGITADLSRSDLLLFCARNHSEVRVIAQAQPHSISSIYSESKVGQTPSSNQAPVVFDALRHQRHAQAHRELFPSGAPVVEDVYPIRGHRGNVIGLVSAEVSLIQFERHRTRHITFRRAVSWLKAMCMRGDLAFAEHLSPFTEWDGVLLVDPQRRISYLSGVANNLYRRLGYLEDLRGKRLSFLNTSDDEMVLAALKSDSALEAEVQEGSRYWIRKVLPVRVRPDLANPLQRLWPGRGQPGEIGGVLIMVHDATDERLKKQELKVKTTMIQEVHHRVKNNLQTVAAMLRMQARRTQDQEALTAINEAISRILSVAVIHEFLSRDERQSINIREICQRIVSQTRQVAVSPGTQITFSLEGPNIHLPSQQATACALVINELIQNALEHGFETRKQGQIRLMLVDEGDRVRLEVHDDGDALPSDFDLATTTSLGLQIVRILVQDDLHGNLTLENHDGGVVARLGFPKVALPQEPFETQGFRSS